MVDLGEAAEPAREPLHLLAVGAGLVVARRHLEGRLARRERGGAPPFRAVNDAPLAVEAQAQRWKRRATRYLVWRRDQAESAKREHGEAGVHVHPRVARRWSAARRHHVLVSEGDRVQRRRHLHTVGRRDAGEVVDVRLDVSRRELALAGGQLALALQPRPIARPPLRAERQRVRRVELGLQVGRVRRHKRGDPLEAVGREGAAESHAAVDRESRDAVLVPPAERLHPQVGVLDRAERVGALGVDAVAAHSRAAAVRLGLTVERRLADRPPSTEGLGRGERDAALEIGDAGVHGVGPSERAVGSDAGFHVLLEGTVAGEPRARLHDDAARLQPARDERQVAPRRRDPLLLHVLGDEAVVVEGEDRPQLAVRARLDAALADLRDEVLVVPADELGDASHLLAVELPPSREDGVARRALHRRAGSRVRAVPHAPARPRRLLRRLYRARRHARRCLAASDGRCRRVGHPQPREHLALVNTGEVEVLDVHGATSSDRVGQLAPELEQRAWNVPRRRRRRSRRAAAERVAPSPPSPALRPAQHRSPTQRLTRRAGRRRPHARVQVPAERLAAQLRRCRRLAVSLRSE
eukprot:7385585-Prymnesium_polylepis.1